MYKHPQESLLFEIDYIVLYHVYPYLVQIQNQRCL